jgi:Protein of unknown function (DUF3144)
MAVEIDDQFYQRADAHIFLSNEQLKEAERDKVSGSATYATARFNAWASASGFPSAEHMTASRQGAIDYFVTQYRTMLEENIDDYIRNFDKYLKAPVENK